MNSSMVWIHTLICFFSLCGDNAWMKTDHARMSTRRGQVIIGTESDEVQTRNDR